MAASMSAMSGSHLAATKTRLNSDMAANMGILLFKINLEG